MSDQSSILEELPVRAIYLETENLDELTARQPERKRSIVQLQRGALRFEMRELAWGQAAIQAERWSCGIHIRQDRPSNYVTFAFVTRGRARWSGAPIAPGSILRIVESWECVSENVFEYAAFAVSRTSFETAASLTRDPGQHEIASGNRVGRRNDAALHAMRLIGDLHALENRASHPATRAAAGEELLRLALLLDRPSNLIPVGRLSSSPGRLKLVRRVEAFLEANGDVIPSIPTLCQIAGVSERTLEYAFREHLGVTPVRYLKLRRLALARRRLQKPLREGESVTEIVAGCGIYELGRFSGEYRRLFGELPSETLARSSDFYWGDTRRSGRRMISTGPRPCPRNAQVDRSNAINPPQLPSTMEAEFEWSSRSPLS